VDRCAKSLAQVKRLISRFGMVTVVLYNEIVDRRVFFETACELSS